MPYILETQFMEQNPRIVLIGCGGTGGFVAEALCRLYTGRDAMIVLVDHDRVEHHNLLRQNFQMEDVGRFKSEALAERLAGKFRRPVGYSTRPFQQDPEGGYPGIIPHEQTLMIGCVDNAAARAEMDRALDLRSRGCWLIDAGNGRNWGQVLTGNRSIRNYSAHNAFYGSSCGVLPSPAMQRPDILVPAPGEQRDVDCAAALDLHDQDPMINQTMAMLVMQMVLRMATGRCSWMSLYLDLELGTMNAQEATPESAHRIAELAGGRVSDGCRECYDFPLGDEDDDEDDEDDDREGPDREDE